MKRFIAGSVCLLLVLVATPFASAEDTDEDLLLWAMSLVQRAIVIDTHADTISAVVNDNYDMTIRNENHHIDIPRLLEGGTDGQYFAAWLNPRSHKGKEVEATLAMIDAIYQVAAKDDRFVVATTAEDIINAHKEGKVAGIPCIEGGKAIVDNLAVLRMYHRLGVRYMTLTWNNNTNWADGSKHDEENYPGVGPHGGLTDFGVEVVKEMNRLGMVVDISHVHDDTFWDVMKVTTKPVIASHSNTWALNPNPRNMKDNMLKALAKNGGVVGVNYYAAFVSKEYDDQVTAVMGEARAKMRELEAKYKDNPEKLQQERRAIWMSYRGKVKRPPLSALVDHIEHIAEVAGYDHVGIGSDWDGISEAPMGLDDTTDTVYLVVELRKRGWSEENIRKFLGENFLRVLKANAGS